MMLWPHSRAPWPRGLHNAQVTGTFSSFSLAHRAGTFQVFFTVNALCELLTYLLTHLLTDEHCQTYLPDIKNIKKLT